MAPRIGPTRVPMPPMSTIMSPWPEKTQNMTSGEAKPRKGAKSAPARPANTAAMTKTTSLKGRGSRPRLVKRRSFSRIASSACPKGERTSARQRSEREHDAGGHQRIERLRRGQARPAPEERGLRHARDAVGAAGQVAPLVGDGVEELGEGQRQHGEVDAGGACGEPSDGEGDRAREQGARQQRHGHGLAEVDQHERARIGAEAEVGGVAERDHARVAHDEIERQGEQSVDEEIGEKRELVTRGHPRHDGQRHEGDRGQRARPPHSSSPKRPQGRKMRMAPITRT